jgi:hypothetical protein
MTQTGRCLCGTVRYELASELGPLINCHCQYCRRAHGAAFVTLSGVAASALRIVTGEKAIREWRTAGVGSRAFCEHCGTRLWNRAESRQDFLTLVVATLDAEPARGPVMHINVESKAPWYEILDALPQHPAFPQLAKRDSQ